MADARAEMNKALGALRYELADGVWDDVARRYQALIAELDAAEAEVVRLRAALTALCEAIECSPVAEDWRLGSPEYAAARAVLADENE